MNEDTEIKLPDNGTSSAIIFNSVYDSKSDGALPTAVLKPLEFFISNIGKRIYRDDNFCNEGYCKDCKDVENNGLIVNDEADAEYLYETQNEYAAEKIILNYRSKK